MPAFVYESESGVAVINAETPEQAKEMLEDHEVEDDCIYLSHNVSVDDLKPLPTDRGVVVHFAAG